MSRTLGIVTAAATLLLLTGSAWAADSAVAAATLSAVDGPSRWDNPKVCPLVSGLPPAEAEFLLGRISEIGREVGVPLAGEHCTPQNLYILVTTDPKGLLRGMERRNRQFTFRCGYGEALPFVVDQFIDTPRPVRVWYNSLRKTKDGQPLGCDDRSAATRRQVVPHGWSSRLATNTIATLFTVFVVVDQTRLQGVTRGQFADYIAMVGLAQIKPDARPKNAPTILSLFDGPPQAAPPGLTDWDLRFLKSLYRALPEAVL